MKQKPTSRDPVTVSVSRSGSGSSWSREVYQELQDVLQTWVTRRASYAPCKVRQRPRAKCTCLACEGVSAARESIRLYPQVLPGSRYTITLIHRSGEKVDGSAPDLAGVKATIPSLREKLLERVKKARETRRAKPPATDTAFGHVNLHGTRTPISLLRSQSETARRNGTVADWKVLAVKTDYGPIGATPHVGVEIECGVSCTVEQLTTAFARAGLGTHVSVGYDGSVSVEERRAVEVRVCDSQARIAETIRRTTEVLNANGGKVNKTCGLHVHLDMRKRDWRAAYTKLYRMLPWLYAIVSESRRTGFEGQNYCRRNGPRPSDNRYHAINSTSVGIRNTLEVRLHQGSTDATKIVNWIYLLTRIVDGPDLKQTPKSLWRVAETYKLPTEIVSWLQERASYAKEEGLLVPQPFNGDC